MASNYKDGGVDLDSIFMAKVSGSVVALGYSVAGTDISTRYQPRDGGVQASATGYQVSGTDLSFYFRKIDDPLGPTIGGDWPENDTDLYDSDENPLSADCGFDFYATGLYDKTDQFSETGQAFLETTGTGEASTCYIKWVKNSGDLPSTNMAAQNTYYQLNQTRYIQYSQSTVGVKQGNFTITIATDNSGSNAVSWTGDMEARQFPGG